MTGGYDPVLLRSRLCNVRLGHVFRIIHRSFGKSPIGASPTPSRFSDPRGGYSVLYASDTVRCAFWETLGRNRFTRRRRRELSLAEVENRLLVSIASTGALTLIDLRDDGPLRIGAPSAVVHDGNHAAGRSLSAAVHAGVAEADGILFPSRFTGDVCLAVFDRAFGKLTARSVVDLARHIDFLDVLDDYGIDLMEPPRSRDGRTRFTLNLPLGRGQ